MTKGPIYGEFDFSKGTGLCGSAGAYARGGKAKPDPGGETHHLSKRQKASAKARASAAGRPYPNLVDNVAAARRKEK